MNNLQAPFLYESAFFAQLFSNYSLALGFFVEIISAQKQSCL